jgi:type IV pilus assembly protein PilA
MVEMKKNIEGFSLIELIIVVLIIGVVAVIAAPNLLSARRAANEGACISALRTLHGAQMTYQTSVGGGNYAGTVSNSGDTVGLNDLLTARLIDDVLGSGSKSGYNFTGAKTLSTSENPATFFFSANPVSDTGITQTGTQRFNVTQTGVLRGDRTNLAIAFTATTTSDATALNN